MYSTQKFMVSVLLTACLFLLSCGSEVPQQPLSARTLSDHYLLFSFKDKTVDQLYIAGIPKDLGNGISKTLSGRLLINETYLTMSIKETIVEDGRDPVSTEKHTNGDFVLDGSVLHLTEYDGASDSMPIVLTEERLVLEDDDVQYIFQSR
jgi:hypothetical protein